MSSLLSLSGGHSGLTPNHPGLSSRTPKLGRKGAQDKTVIFKCQRLNADKQFEEVDVEVPAPIYDTLRFYNSESSASSGLDTTSSRGSRQSEKADIHMTKNKTFTSKIRSLFGKAS